MSYNSTLLTCRTWCELYDETTQECGIYKNVDVDDPIIVHTCHDFIESTSLDEPNNEDDDTESYLGNNISNKKINYPVQPDCESKRDDALWYVSPNTKFGCWIVNKYRKRFFIIKQTPKKDIEFDIPYRSPVPLHDHQAKALSSNMCWFIDENGWGRYTLLIDGEIRKLFQ
ncbi:hypothetical protein VBD025_00815 [Virgibacillus flavescens]|uniref:hypothetical protein n=1 Tax=Virgibacillus flavescens TaxID=1611422 RepID=UPI003D334F91